jgi:hypothetical protein
MRFGMICLLPLVLAACQNEPDFDARFDQANAEIAAKVKALDEEAAKVEAAAEAEQGQAAAPQILITKDGKAIQPANSGL